MVDEPIVAEPEEGRVHTPPRPVAEMDDVLDMVWPETGLQTGCRVSARPKDLLGEYDVV